MDAKEIKTSLKKAREEIRLKEFKNALKYCKEVLEVDKTNYMALVLIAVAAEGLYEYDQARNAYKQAIQVDDNQVLAWQGLCSFYEKNYIAAFKSDHIDVYLRLIEFYKDDLSKKTEFIGKLVRLCDTSTDCVTLVQIEQIVEEFISCHPEYDEDTESVLSFHSSTLLKRNGELLVKVFAELLMKYPISVSILKASLLTHVDQLIAGRVMVVPEEVKDLTRRYQAAVGNQGCDILCVVQAYTLMAANDAPTALQLLTNVRGQELVCERYLQARCRLQLHQYDRVLECCQSGVTLLGRKDRIFTQHTSSMRRCFQITTIAALIQLGDLASLNTAQQILTQEIGVDDDETSLLNGQIYYTLGDLDKAKANLVGESVQRWTLEGLIHFKQGDTLHAQQMFKRAIVEEPDCASHYLNLAKCLWIQDNQQECCTLLLKAAKMDPHCSETFQYLGHYYEARQDNARAQKCFHKAFDLDPHNDVSGEKLCDFLTETGEEDVAYQILLRVTSLYAPGRGKWAWLRLGLYQMKHDDPSVAIASLQAALRAHSIDPHIWECLGDAYQCRGSYTAALKAFNRALELNSKSIYCLFQISSIKQKLGKLTEAVEEYNTILQLSPDYVPALKGLGETYMTIGRSLLTECFHGRARDTAQLAVKHLHRASNLRPDISCIWKLMGDTCTMLHVLPTENFRLEVPDKGIFTKLEILEYGNRCYAKALKILPECSTLWHDLGVNYIRQSLTGPDDDATSTAGRAARALKKAIQLDPKNYQHWNALGYVLCQKADYQPAMAQHCFIKSIQAEHNNVIAWTNLAALYLKHDNIKLAHEAFKTAQSLEPSYVACWIGQAIIAELVEHEDAMDLFRHSTQLHNHVEGSLGYGHWVCSVLLHSDRKDGAAYIYAIDKMGAVPAASDALAKYTDRVKNNPLAYNMHGLLLERQKLYTAAAQQLYHGKELLEQSGLCANTMRDVLSNYARILRKIGDYNTACGIYERLETADVLSMMEICDWALVEYHNNNSTHSLTLYSKALKMASTDLDRSHIMAAIAMVQYKMADIEAAKTTLFHSSQLQAVSIHSLMALFALGFVQSDLTLVAASTHELSQTHVNKAHQLDVTLLQCLGYLVQNGVDAVKRLVQCMVHVEPCRGDMWYTLSLVLLNYYPQLTEAASHAARNATLYQYSDSDEDDKMLVPVADIQHGCHGGSNSCKKAFHSAQRAVHLYPDKLSGWVCLTSACHLEVRGLTDVDKKRALLHTQQSLITYLCSQDTDAELKKWCMKQRVGSSALGNSPEVMDHLKQLMSEFGSSADVAEYFTTVSQFLQTRP